ncbi:MAG: VOC family protein [Alphaproteobacteria bacterium]|nr:VOC family protein [Alphaproteobacteria bacterium]MBL6938731.1 VOC family protein [Alphaproteobacteria bacterium]MBL7097912.1 VOC family protein [Alphaproteobacteria bacterium]
METRFTYAIRYVADMDKAIAFYRDKLGLKLSFPSPGWSEFDTGSVTLALHIATKEKPAGTTELGFRTEDVQREYAAKSLNFPAAPRVEHGVTIATFTDMDGAPCALNSHPEQR